MTHFDENETFDSRMIYQIESNICQKSNPSYYTVNASNKRPGRLLLFFEFKGASIREGRLNEGGVY